MKKSEKPVEVWHYPGKGDFPAVGQLVWVQAVSLAPWVRAVVKSEPCGSPVRFQAESMYGGKLETSGVHYWENLTCHDIVTAWREHEAPSDKAEILRATEHAQRMAAKNDNYLYFLIASSLEMNPKIMRPMILEKMKRFMMRIKKIGDSAFVNADTPVVDAHCPDYVDEQHGIVYVVEEHAGHGVIRQTEKGKSESRYAKDFPGGKTIFATPHEAGLALIAMGEKMGWRAVV